MILILVLGYLCHAAASNDLDIGAQSVELETPNCNCSHLLNQETTDVTPTFPSTSFTCWGRYDGYYADVEVDCTIFHYCQTFTYPSGLNETVKWDFACPQSTIFNQKVLSCTPPNISFDCQESPNYYWVNYNLTATTTTSAPTLEHTTPHNFGQQLIVGGAEEQSVSIQDSNTTPKADLQQSDAPDTPTFVPSTSTQMVTSSNLDDSSLSLEVPNEGNDSEAIKFPM